MSVRRKIALLLFALVAPLVVAACTTEGDGYKSECEPSGCTVTFDRGVNAKASVLGVEAELVAVDGNQARLKVAGQEVTVPVGESEPTDGMSVTVREITEDNVVVRIATGL